MSNVFLIVPFKEGEEGIGWHLPSITSRRIILNAITSSLSSGSNREQSWLELAFSSNLCVHT